MGQRIYRSDEPDIEIPDVTLSEHVMGGAAARGDHPAIIDTAAGVTYTYAELAQKVDEVAAYLQTRDVRRGNVVGLIGANSADWAIAYHAILRAGAVVTPMNPLLTREEIEKQVRDSRAELVIDNPAALLGDAEPGA